MKRIDLGHFFSFLIFVFNYCKTVLCANREEKEIIIFFFSYQTGKEKVYKIKFFEYLYLPKKIYINYQTLTYLRNFNSSSHFGDVTK